MISEPDSYSRRASKASHLAGTNSDLENIVHLYDSTRYKALHAGQSFVTGLGASGVDLPFSEWRLVNQGGTFSYSYFTKHKTEVSVLLAKQTGAAEVDDGQ